MDDRSKHAWEIYCRETAGSFDVRDSWEQLPKYVQEIFLAKSDAWMEFHWNKRK